MKLDIRSAKKSEAPLLATLMQMYLAEFATFETVQQDPRGNYVYPYLSHYWEDPNRYPFLLRMDDELAGFALVRFEADPVTGSEVMDMTEFFVIDAFKRQGVGTRAAEHLWNLFPGRWHVRVLTSNRNAYPFWKKVIAKYTETNYTEKPPERAIGGSYTFVFDSAVGVELPDDPDLDVVDW